MQDLRFADESFLKSKTNDCELLIEISRNHLYSTVFDTSQKKFVALFANNNDFSVYPSGIDLEKIAQFFHKDLIFKAKYRKINLIYSSGKFTIVPASLFEKDKSETFYHFVFKTEENETIHFQRLKNANAVLIFALPSEFEKIGKTLKGNYAIVHKAAVLLENYLISSQKIKPDESQQLFAVNVENDRAFVFFVNEGKLLLHNSFDFSNESDFCYYVLNNFEQLKIKNENQSMAASGEIDINSLHYKLLKKFIRNIYFEKRNTDFQYDFRFNEIAQQRFYSLLNFYNCEL